MTAGQGDRDPMEGATYEDIGRKEHYSADDEIVDDPAALEAAQAAANSADPYAKYAAVQPDWVAVWGPAHLGSMQGSIDQMAAMLTIPLDAEEIAWAWDPFPPPEGYARQGISRPFTLLVAPQNAERARELIESLTPQEAKRLVAGGPSAPDLQQPSLEAQQANGFFTALLVMAIAVGVIWAAALVLHFNHIKLLGP